MEQKGRIRNKGVFFINLGENMYNNNDITYFETINKCKELIKNEEKKIVDSNFIISTIEEKLVNTVKSMCLHYTIMDIIIKIIPFHISIM